MDRIVRHAKEWVNQKLFEVTYNSLLYDIEDAVISVLNGTERTSSMIENLHSRLRPFFFLRREIGFDYLQLLRFYLNHTPFLRSKNNRAKKIPAELLTGKSHLVTPFVT